MSMAKELTWQDIRAIVRTHAALLNTLDYDKIRAMGEEGFYKEVLQRLGKTE